MKLIVKNKRSVFACMALCTLINIMVGCQEGDGNLDYGFGYVYIPQATVSGGLNNHYRIPSGAGSDTYNFREESGKLNIILGVTRSGKISNAAGFTVDVVVSSTLTQEAVSSGSIANAVALPSSMYEISDKVTVNPGSNYAAFYLSVNINALMDSMYNGKNLVLAVGISNPTKFELSEKNTVVLVVIDVNAVRLLLDAES